MISFRRRRTCNDGVRIRKIRVHFFGHWPEVNSTPVGGSARTETSARTNALPAYTTSAPQSFQCLGCQALDHKQIHSLLRLTVKAKPPERNPPHRYVLRENSLTDVVRVWFSGWTQLSPGERSCQPNIIPAGSNGSHIASRATEHQCRECASSAAFSGPSLCGIAICSLTLQQKQRRSWFQPNESMDHEILAPFSRRTRAAFPP